MKYTLITRQGKIFQFYMESVAQSYRSLYGGVVFTQQILENVLTTEADSDIMVS